MSIERIMHQFYREKLQATPQIPSPNLSEIGPTFWTPVWEDLLGLLILLLCIIHYFAAEQWLSPGRFFTLMKVTM